MTIPMHRLQVADRVLGKIASLVLQPARWLRRRSKPAPPKRVLAVKFWGLGSLQLLTPSFRALRRRHPQADLVLLTLESNREFAEGLGLFDRVECVDLGATRWRHLIWALMASAHGIRRQAFDVVYDFEFFTRFSAVVSLLSGAPRTFGFSAPGITRGGFHTDLVPFRRSWHVARNFRALAGGENGADVQPSDLKPYCVRPDHRLEATLALIENDISGPGPLVILNPNAGELSLERRWPAERYAELARRLVVEDGARVIVVGSAREREHVRHVRALIGLLPKGRCIDLSGRLSFGGLVALLRQAEVFITNDSGPMHVAAAQGVPTIGLFGPETPQLYRPIGHRARFLYAPTLCSPCINVHNNKLITCHRGKAECMTNLSVGYALAAARDEIGRQRNLTPLPESIESC